MKRVMGIDYGDARTGVALSDLLCSIVGSTTVIHSRRMDKTLLEICRIVKEQDVGEIVVGLPKNMNGSLGPRAEKCQAFANMLNELVECPVNMWDERSTTVTAHQILNETNVRGKNRKAVVDTVAATVILEAYLDYRRKNKK